MRELQGERRAALAEAIDRALLGSAPADVQRVLELSQREEAARMSDLPAGWLCAWCDATVDRRRAAVGAVILDGRGREFAALARFELHRVPRRHNRAAHRLAREGALGS